MNDTLFQFLDCHSTPGDEAEVRDLLNVRWRQAGCTVVPHGRYAISASMSDTDSDKPVLLICAHMDSPGFIVEQVHDDSLVLIALGSPRPGNKPFQADLKTAARQQQVVLHRDDEENGPARYVCEAVPGAAPGDRACYAPTRHISDGILHAPFIDNRFGCALLVELADALGTLAELPVRVTLGATACEEMGGFGAPVLAHAIQPDGVICLDATYECEEQNVLLGRGPVLTLSDASVLLSIRDREAIDAFFANHGLPLQKEVYNISGTDAKAFPFAGLSAPVLSLLAATRGNHTPAEQVALADTSTVLNALTALVKDGARLFERLCP